MTTPWSHHWTHDPEIDYLNHGAFGGCPRAVLDVQAELRARLERNAMQFMLRDLEPATDAVREALGAFVGADPADLAFVRNATTGVNTVLRSLSFEPGDEILVTDHAYAACRNALDRIAVEVGARVVVVALPFPTAGAASIVDAILSQVGPRTRLALLDHVSSPTGLVFPIVDLVTGLRERGVDTLVDGAHAPGMLPLDLESLGAAYYTANCHKWICAPKGAAFLWVRRDRQSRIHPLVTSHGATATRGDRSRFLLEFDWLGTDDPTAYLSIPAALQAMQAMVPGGWEEVRQRNRDLALAARAVLCRALAIEPPGPESMIGSLVALPLPLGPAEAVATIIAPDGLQRQLQVVHRFEVPVFRWPAAPRRILRVSCQLYNSIEQYERLAAVLPRALAGENAL